MTNTFDRKLARNLTSNLSKKSNTKPGFEHVRSGSYGTFKLAPRSDSGGSP